MKAEFGGRKAEQGFFIKKNLVPPSTFRLPPLLLAALFGFSFQASAQEWLTNSPKGVEDMAFLKRMRVEAQRAHSEGRLQSALALLAKTPTGKPLAALVDSGLIHLVPDAGGAGAYFQDRTKTVYFDREFADRGEVWQDAVLLAHELEHARQSLAGVTADAARGVREAGAFLVQCQVWVELGARVRQKDLANNEMNSQDMLAWVASPTAIIAALELRGEWTVQSQDSVSAAYWARVWNDNQNFRAANKGRLPPADDKSVIFVLEQALTVRKGNKRIQ